MKQTYTGGCQCGKVCYELQTEITKVVSCNCSRCSKWGALMSAVPLSDFKLLSGAEAVTVFQFNKNLVHHPFCATCGIQSYAHGKAANGMEMVMINVRCLDGVDATQFEVMTFDGRSL